MRDTTKAKWDFSKEDEQIFDWLEKHGFDAILEKQYISKMKIRVSKNGLESVEDFPSGRVFDVSAYMGNFLQSWEMFSKIQKRKEMSDNKRKALETLDEVMRIYTESESDILCGGFWSDFAELVNRQKEQIEKTTV